MRKLIAAGEQIDQQDNAKLTALASSICIPESGFRRSQAPIGAQADTSVGQAGVPVALLPVLNADIEGVRLMRQNEVSYSKLRYRGATALEIAKGLGNPALLDALGGKETDL